MFKKKQKESPSQIKYEQSKLQTRSLRKWLDSTLEKKRLFRNKIK